MPRGPVFRSGRLPYVLLAYLHHSGFSSQSRYECAKLTWQNWDDKRMSTIMNVPITTERKESRDELFFSTNVDAGMQRQMI